MPEIDPVTGYPRDTEIDPETGELRKAPKRIDRVAYDRLQSIKGKADQVQEAINSDEGQLVLHKIEEQFLERVYFLMEHDAECIALKKLLASIGRDLNMGKVAVDRLMKMMIKK